MGLPTLSVLCLLPWHCQIMSVAIHLVFRNVRWYGCLTTPPWLSCVTCEDCRDTPQRAQKQEAELWVWFPNSRRRSLNFNSCRGFKWPRGPMTLCRSVTGPKCTSMAHWAALQCLSEELVKLVWTGNTVFSKQFLWLSASFLPCLLLLACACNSGNGIPGSAESSRFSLQAVISRSQNSSSSNWKEKKKKSHQVYQVYNLIKNY